MMDDIREILQCPVSGEPLRPMLPDELHSINRRILRNGLSQADGMPVKGEMEGGYIAHSGRLAYSIREGIAVLLSDRAIVLDNDRAAIVKERIMSRETGQVQAFYDKTGWKKTAEGNYEDTARFVDNRPVLYGYFSRCNSRIMKHVKKKGKYLVDVACGPIHYDAYRAMSDGYDYRICIDVSFEALREAKKQMGSRGIYLMADITNMPLRNDSVDDVISLHTLYHVPADRQVTALKEIHRILKPASTGVVIYSWGDHSVLMRAALRPRSSAGCNESEPGSAGSQLYSHTHDYSFFMKQPLGFDMDVNVWSSISSVFTRTYIPKGRMGTLLLKIIANLEDAFPHLAGRFGQYPLFIIKKPSMRS